MLKIFSPIAIISAIFLIDVLDASTFDKHFPSSCQDPAIIEDGEYYIYPDGLSPVLVYCDVTKGGWATIFNKADKSDFFNRSWTDYVYGFGSPRSNYWAGLLNIRNLVLTEPMVLRIELSNSARDEFFIEYESFFIDSAEHQYLLKVGNKTAGIFFFLEAFSRQYLRCAVIFSLKVIWSIRFRTCQMPSFMRSIKTLNILQLRLEVSIFNRLSFIT